jgi:hypothetical protein
VAQCGAGAARENSSNEGSLLRQLRSVHGVDAGPDRMDATALDAVLDLIAREAEREQLDACYHPVLPLRELARCPLNIFTCHSP